MKNIVQGCIQKFLDWLPGVRTANGTALCANMQLYHYLVNFAAITLCAASQQVVIVVSIYFIIDSVQKLLDTLSYMNITASKNVKTSNMVLQKNKFGAN
jgi:uncharacterized membrane protein